jgi:hypothetical protein
MATERVLHTKTRPFPSGDRERWTSSSGLRQVSRSRESDRQNLTHRVTYEPATDVAAEMGVLEVEFSSCKTCYNACSAAVKMLAVSAFPIRIKYMLIASRLLSISARDYQRQSKS